MNSRIVFCSGLLMSIFVWTDFIAWGQIPVPKKAYFHLSGTVNKENPISLEMVKSGDSVYCDYLLANPGLSTVPVFCGKMNSNTGAFTFHKPFGSDGWMIKGKWVSGQGFTGTWEEPGTGKYPIEWKENYPVGTVQFNVSYAKESIPLVNKPKSPRAKIEMVLLTPAESVNPVISDTLTKFIIEEFTGRPYAKQDPQSVLNAVKTVYFRNYKNSNESLYEQIPDAGILNWESLKFMHVLHNSNYVLCFYIQQYAFTGGAHGLESTDYYVINLMSGKKIAVTDLFREGTEARLSELITQDLKKRYCRNNEASLKEAGFFTDEVKPGINFFITDNGIGFHYNPYDLAPYSFGAIEAFLDFTQVSDLLKPASELPVKLGK